MMESTLRTIERSRKIDQSRSKPVPVEPGFWLLVFGDLLVFTVMFIALVMWRHESQQAHAVSLASSQLLNTPLAAINTIVLLTSSYLVARGLIQFRGGLLRSAQISLVLAIVCGLAFAVIKVIEYAEKVAQGITVTTNPFFEFYFTFTGVHLLHVIIGTGLLCYLVFALHKAAVKGAPSQPLFDGIACYWHMVDLLWLMLFALFYMIE